MSPVQQGPRPTIRLRMTYAALALAIVAAGLLWRWPGLGLSPAMAKYGGSVWWGALVYASLRVMLPGTGVKLAATFSCALAALVEFSQLLHWPWLDAFRSTKFGLLLIGRFFSWWDIASYWLGIAAASAVDFIYRVRSLDLSSRGKH
jgi:hypothetical protein